ncbi:MAG: hypothetical protein VX906_00265, partial [Candidatus Thermoplasmatota archaeon]|nr:hypothetical protein [Candidatus Thermoplasmatota archaeon]
PEGFRLRVQDSVSVNALENLDRRDVAYLDAVCTEFEKCEWIPDEINSVICNEARSRDISIRDAFQTLYWIVLDQDFGPKLANILAEMDRSQSIQLLNSTKNKLAS